MKKIMMLALLSTLTVGAFANGHKPKKHKSCEHCTQQKCTPACKDKSNCTKMSCDKS